MSRYGTGVLAIVLALSWVEHALADTHIDINVYPAFAPRGTISPSWTEYVSNTTSAIAIQAPTAGGPEQNPSGYQQVSSLIMPLDIIYTDYPSWHAMADPNPAFYELSNDFQSEFGNRIHFGVHIVSHGITEFALHDLSWALDSDDATDYFDQEGTFASHHYSKVAVGIVYGEDGMRVKR